VGAAVDGKGKKEQDKTKNSNCEKKLTNAKVLPRQCRPPCGGKGEGRKRKETGLKTCPSKQRKKKTPNATQVRLQPNN